MRHALEQAALEAGSAILAVAAKGPGIRLKSDQSPVTEADEQAEAIVLAHLAEHFAGIPVVAEEEIAAGRFPAVNCPRFFLVDALDGTKEFIAGKPDYTVNIALIDQGRPVAGVVYAPAYRKLYSADAGIAEAIAVGDDGMPGARRTIRTRTPQDPLVAIASRSHNSPRTGEYLSGLGTDRFQSIGSSLKFCMLAEGEADVYPRFTRTMQWDTAAGDAVLRAAGGATLELDGRPLLYGERREGPDEGYANPYFVAWGRIPHQYRHLARG
ncbi:3'(2'),5'-bisphosphate nucleotidase CysQ [Gellertiella hungarica]|uniref:3'(2'),5'-bisphosphate nucleotidase CysQ n=1 Tax=Gellertiella hungarica TaxID=1572859 RepID=A0A7W6NJ81_9HYPH|nr:3'(2'),5'-bisphosphate nucleotidase CysQ [Gellertiella hungarica]MBB4063204.1 3'(2'), 5'-bisphosphate nucleotidase [Gellertiella hungarica]